MNQYLIYLNLENYLAQWYINQCGGRNPVQISRGSAESDVINLFISRTPAGEIPESAENSNIAIVIPFFKNKDIRYYNYLPKYGKKALINTIYTRFRVQLWQELHSVENIGCSITDLVYAWLEKHGIDQDEKNWETVRQMYFRMRKLNNQKNNRKSLLPKSESLTK